MPVLHFHVESVMKKRQRTIHIFDKCRERSRADDRSLVGTGLTKHRNGKKNCKQDSESDRRFHSRHYIGKVIVPTVFWASKTERGKPDEFDMVSIGRNHVGLLAWRLRCARVADSKNRQRRHLHRPTGNARSGALSKAMFHLSWAESR